MKKMNFQNLYSIRNVFHQKTLGQKAIFADGEQRFTVCRGNSSSSDITETPCIDWSKLKN